jgi:hypothetical protein
VPGLGSRLEAQDLGQFDSSVVQLDCSGTQLLVSTLHRSLLLPVGAAAAGAQAQLALGAKVILAPPGILHS